MQQSLIDDISRFARNVQAHIKLRETLSDAGGILESPSIEFGEDSDSRLVEHMLASVAQHQREKNAEQTSNRMKGRMMNGFAVFAAPIGYAYKKTAGRGRLLTRVEPVASIIQEGLEGFASGRIGSQAELKRFFEAQPDFPKDLPNGKIRQQKVTDILKRVIYAGYIEHDRWGISRRKGHHEPIISLATYEQIQARRNARNLAPVRTDIREDFPLRGAVNCGCCDHPLTSCWSKSATGKRYPYYWCNNRDCAEYRKSIRAERVDAAFETMLHQMTPTPDLLTLVSAMLKDAWDQRLGQAKHAKAATQHDIAQCDKQQDMLLERLVETSNPKVIGALESKIARLEQNKLLLTEKLEKSGKPKHSMGETFELLKGFLASPWNIYENGTLALKKTVLKTVFAAPLVYDRKGGFRTPQTTAIFGFLEKITKM